MLKSLPNLLSLLRILLIPVLVAVFYLPYEWARPVAAAIFGIAGLTDWLDGYLARKLNLQSRMGAFLDPVADKLLVAAVLVLLTGAANSIWVTLPALIIISREITISALREWMAEVGQRGKVAVSYLGKVKTTTQIIALLLLLFEWPLFGLPIYTLGMIMLYVAAILTLWSMIDYLRVALSGSSISAE
jgi:CDP-diacylglycerol--glycerol-3-phosphate 3-phosphatidyltransferase